MNDERQPDIETQLCDEAGMVSNERVPNLPTGYSPTFLEQHNFLTRYNGAGRATQSKQFACTGSAHYGKFYMRCTSSAHSVPSWEPAEKFVSGTIDWQARAIAAERDLAAAQTALAQTESGYQLMKRLHESEQARADAATAALTDVVEIAEVGARVGDSDSIRRMTEIRDLTRAALTAAVGVAADEQPATERIFAEAQRQRCTCDGAGYFTSAENAARSPFIVNAGCPVHSKPVSSVAVPPETPTTGHAMSDGCSG